MMGRGWEMGPMMFFGGLFWLFLLIILAIVVFRLLHVAAPPDRHREQRSSGLSILEERYARGEINRDEYLQKKRDILERTTG